ncbi:type II toxin-antitoxin system RelE/ParE family toxin [Alicyclobacillus sp. SP_1]|uniref:type II toxin-antitoxin system RelE family toxin n=1 Tax=Alicyclobacillus sp. SP_1 TaxID=2942475 RepID=UPI0035BE46A0
MYSLIFSKDARKFIDKQTAQTKQRIRNALLQLAENPFSNRQVKRLKGTEDILRLRVGDFRVVFSIEEDKLVILVISIGSRGDIYNRF